MKMTLAAFALAFAVIATSGAANAMPLAESGFWYEETLTGN